MIKFNELEFGKEEEKKSSKTISMGYKFCLELKKGILTKGRNKGKEAYRVLVKDGDHTVYKSLSSKNKFANSVAYAYNYYKGFGITVNIIEPLNLEEYGIANICSIDKRFKI